MTKVYDASEAKKSKDVAIAKLNKILSVIKDTRPEIYAHVEIFSIKDVNEINQLPITKKSELLQDQLSSPPFGSIHVSQKKSYVRVHQTSGSTGVPLKWADTRQDWEWRKKCWNVAFDAAGVTESDVAFFPFAFNFFAGIWSAFCALEDYGPLVLPGGGQSSLSRLKTIWEYKVSVMITTPSYCFKLLQTARDNDINIVDSPIRIIFLVGEPGGCLHSVKQRIEAEWGCKVFDNYGSTELGAVGYQCISDPHSIHLNEDEFYIEVLDPENHAPCALGEYGELIVTPLGRLGGPLLRYSTGDLVKLSYEECECGSPHVRAIGGVISRCDDMIIVKGVNLYPSKIDSLMRSMDYIIDYRCDIDCSLDNPKILLKCEVNRSIDRNIVSKMISHIWKDILMLVPEIVFLDVGDLGYGDGKVKRVYRI